LSSISAAVALQLQAPQLLMKLLYDYLVRSGLLILLLHGLPILNNKEPKISM